MAHGSRAWKGPRWLESPRGQRQNLKLNVCKLAASGQGLAGLNRAVFYLRFARLGLRCILQKKPTNDRDGTMPVYRLEPRNGDTLDPNWAASRLLQGCWVLAESEQEARLNVTFATTVATKIEFGTPIKASPWQFSDLTTCVIDKAPGRQPTHGAVIAFSGRKFSIPGAKRGGVD
jgi:hypothetical protein